MELDGQLRQSLVPGHRTIRRAYCSREQNNDDIRARLFNDIFSTRFGIHPRHKVVQSDCLESSVLRLLAHVGNSMTSSGTIPGAYSTRNVPLCSRTISLHRYSPIAERTPLPVSYSTKRKGVNS